LVIFSDEKVEIWGNFGKNCLVKVVIEGILDTESGIFEGNCGYLKVKLRGEEGESVNFDDFGKIYGVEKGIFKVMRRRRTGWIEGVKGYI
jgi:hypothetical protein